MRQSSANVGQNHSSVLHNMAARRAVCTLLLLAPAAPLMPHHSRRGVALKALAEDLLAAEDHN